jgi:hypothetical protein
MKTIINLFVEEFGEVDAFFDAETGELLHYWSCNDAAWRHEYMAPLFEKVGVRVLRDHDVHETVLKQFKARLKKELKKQGWL